MQDVFRRGAALSIIGLSVSACASSKYSRGTVEVVLHEKVVDSSVFTRQVVPPRLSAIGVGVEGTRLSGRLEMAALCQREQVDMVERTVRRDVGPIDEDGELASVQSIGGMQIGLGLLMPIITPICYAAGCGSDDADPDPTVSGLEVAFIAGSVIGGIMVISGIVDVARGGVDEGEWEVEPPTERRADLGAPFACEVAPPDFVQVKLQIGTATAAVALMDSGVFSHDLTPLAPSIIETPDARWRLELPDGHGLFLDVPARDRYQLAGHLEAQAAETSSVAAP